MKRFVLICLLLAAVLSAEVLQEDNVYVLDDTNYDEFLAQHEYILVEFYAPWCGHCKSLAPEYAKAAAITTKWEKPVPLAKVDATVSPKTAAKYGVQGYPTLKFFINQEPIEYGGGRVEKDIVNWVAKRVGDYATTVTSREQFYALTAQNKVVIAYFGESIEDADLAVFKLTAMEHDSLSFVRVFDSSLKHELNPENSRVVLFKQFDEGKNHFEGDYSQAALKKFIDTSSFANVLEFDDRAIAKIFHQRNPTIFLFHTAEHQATREIFNQAANILKGKLVFSVSTDFDGFGHYQKLAEYLGVNLNNVPQLIIIEVEKDVAKFRFTGTEITVESITEYVNNYKTAKPSVKSDANPATNSEAVKVIVGNQFNELVIDNDQDVLVEFYAPWCGHCKTLAPIYDATATKLLVNRNIVLAKMDYTTNEVPGLEIKGYPTLKLFKSGQKDTPVDYEGDRTEAGILAFLQKNIANAWVELKEQKDDL